MFLSLRFCAFLLTKLIITASGGFGYGNFKKKMSETSTIFY